MIYLWDWPNDFSHKLIADYDRDLSPDRFFLLRGVKLYAEQMDKKPIFVLETATSAEISKFDSIPNNANVPLINEKIVNLLSLLAPNEVQFFDAEIRCKDGILTSYKLLNVIGTIVGIDHEKSIYTTMEPVSKAILGFDYLTYKPGCMSMHKLARDKEYSVNILVVEEVKQAFEKAKITGVCFIAPEDFYKPFNEYFK